MITLLVGPALLLIHHCHYRDTEMEEKEERKEEKTKGGRREILMEVLGVHTYIEYVLHQFVITR